MDRDVVERARSGDQEAFAELVHQVSDTLLGVARRILRDPALAEDVLQDAFLQIWRGAGTFNPFRGSGRGWIYTVVRHCALNAVRGACLEINVDSSDLENLADHRQADEEVHMSIGIADLEHCLSLLMPDKRACIVLAFVEGFTHEQIALKLNAPLGTVKTRIRRGLLCLKDQLS